MLRLSGLIFLLSFLVYLPGLRNGFIYDDKFQILRNPLVKGERPFSEIFTTEFYRSAYGRSSYYRPLVNLSYWLDFRFYSEKPFGYHLSNLLLHGLASVLAFLSLWRWSKNLPLAGLAGMIFAVHPSHTQSVSWISGRTDLLCALFIFLMLYFYFSAQEASRARRLSLLFLSGLSFCLALFSKELAVLALPLLLLMEWARVPKLKWLFQRPKTALYVGFLGIILMYFLLRLKFLGFALGYQAPSISEWYYQNQTDFSRIATVFKVYFYYLRTLIFPLQLCFESKMLVASAWRDFYLMESIGAVLILLGLGIFLLKKFPEMALGILWFFLSLLPVANIFPYRELTMEHLLYLPSLGFILALALSLERLITSLEKKPKKWQRILAWGSLGLMIFLFSALSWERQAVWKDELVFWRDAVMKAPLKRRPWYNLGIRLKEKGEARSALRCWRMAEKAEPLNPEVHNNLGAIYFELGEIDSAIREFEEALRLNPNHPKARINLETVLRLKAEREAKIP